ncbi:unnamed protein product [Dibothriocephalus latus]|uniref:Uncharacterized protein n=1 Tax=Dibothriocephalus latus TaxID=60516 RepID=A0A3P7P9B7_DIBLA|nr:unnamed protein product [Dibothriocephalus latus]
MFYFTEPRFTKTYGNVKIAYGLAKAYEDVPVFITYYELVPDQALYVHDRKAEQQIDGRRTEMAYQVRIYDYEIHGLTDEPTRKYTLRGALTLSASHDFLLCAICVYRYIFIIMNEVFGNTEEELGGATFGI